MCDCNAPSLRTATSEYGDALRKKIAEEHEAKKAIVMAIEDKMVASSDCGSEETSSNLVYRPIFRTCNMCGFTIVNSLYVVTEDANTKEFIFTHTKCYIDKK